MDEPRLRNRAMAFCGGDKLVLDPGSHWLKQTLVADRLKIASWWELRKQLQHLSEEGSKRIKTM